MYYTLESIDFVWLSTYMLYSSFGRRRQCEHFSVPMLERKTKKHTEIIFKLFWHCRKSLEKTFVHYFSNCMVVKTIIKILA